MVKVKAYAFPCAKTPVPRSTSLVKEETAAVEAPEEGIVAISYVIEAFTSSALVVPVAPSIGIKNRYWSAVNRLAAVSLIETAGVI